MPTADMVVESEVAIVEAYANALLAQSRALGYNLYAVPQHQLGTPKDTCQLCELGIATRESTR